MNVDFEKYPLPLIYKRGGKECYLDPVRNKLIYITPEESIRQHIISYLLKELKVSINMLRVEAHLSHYGVNSKKRADILIHKYDKEQDVIIPLVVIECKAPGVLLGEKAMNQMLNYSNALGCNYAMITNGNTMFCYKYDENKEYYVAITELPVYLQMIKNEFTLLEIDKPPERIEFGKLEEMSEIYIGVDIGESTPLEKRVPMVNLIEGLLYTEHKMPTGNYQLFKLLEDYGVRLLSYGNNSGGVFSGPYRSFLVDFEGSVEFVSIGLARYATWAKPDIIKTSINVAIDNEKEAHHSLQLVVDENMIVVGEKCLFYHHGRIGVSNIGSGKVDELRQFVATEYPQIIDGKCFFLGTLTNNRLWNLDDKEVVNFVENLISYSLIRDRYRSFLKNNQ